MAANIRMECAATGTPEPNIQWFRNGELLASNSVIVVDGGLLRIHSVDPTDDAIYQCFASNAAGMAYSTAYLTVRTSTTALEATLPRVYDVKCYPIDYQSILVTFRATKPVHMINYYLMGDTLEAVAPAPVPTNHHFNITGLMDPLRAYTLHLRGFTTDPHQMTTKVESRLIMSRLSKGIKCQTQGLELLSTAFPDHVFLWWPPTNGKNNYTAPVDHYLIQLWGNDTRTSDNNWSMDGDVTGTNGQLDEYKTWNEIDQMLHKIPAEMSVINTSYVVDGAESFLKQSIDGKRRKPSIRFHFNVTQIKVPRNVSGILIPNTKRVWARVIGVRAGEVIPDEELQYVQWKKVENSDNGVSKLRIVSANSKNVQLAWNAFGRDKSTCLMLCYKNTSTDFLRGSVANCISM